MTEDAFNRASQIKTTLFRVNKVIEAVEARQGVMIEHEHFALDGPLGAALYAELKRYFDELCAEFRSL